jgi:molybdopterin-guanine dinucleotide biosynthesis protein A
MVKIYTHYSNSHKQLYDDFFKASLRALYTKEEVIIKVLNHAQTTQDGMFMTQGWLDSMDFKLDVILTAIEETFNDWFIFADCDIQFFKPFVADLQDQLTDADIVCQEDCGSLCAGFFACKSNNDTKKLFQTIKSTFRYLVNDQVALNEHKNLVKYKLLDNKKYFTIGNFFNNKDGTHNWDNVTNIVPPKEILVHHANYVKGVTSKLQLIKMIKHNYENLV